ncbi:MAG: PAS domain-containing sensor histidine kinase [Bacteroidales bacterium]|nr:PAS domain-containing sensor histidine kinase [Bacteroidales bacterium]
MIWWIAVGTALLLCLIGWGYRRYVWLPKQTLAIGADLLRQQDFNSRLRKIGNREVDRIIDLFNPMMDALDSKAQRIEEQEKFLNQIMEISPTAIVTVDDQGGITYANPAFRAMADADVWERVRGLELGESQVFRLNTGAAYRGTHLSYMDRGFAHDFYIIESLTAEMAEAERHAYEQVIRTVSHEVNNTVCGVNSTLEAIGQIISDTDAERVIAACQTRTRNLSDFVSRYAQMVKLPQPVMREVALNDFVAGIAPFLGNLCAEHECEFSWQLDRADARVMIDPALMEQALVNIVKNACENPGCRHVSLAVDGRKIEVVNDGEPIPEEVSQHLFTPFFTTKPTGQGIGLTTVRTILTGHHCRFSLSSDGPLTRFTICL